MTAAVKVPATATQVRAVAHPHAPAEHEADRFAERTAGGAGLFAGWAFDAVPVHDPAPDAAVDTALTEPGRPLDRGLARSMGAQLRTDLSGVRIHDGLEGADLARRAGADAVTVGTDIAFARGRYDPSTSPGRRRVAHEAAHVAQRDPLVAHRDGKGPVAPATTLGGLPEADRKKIQVTSTTKITVTGIEEKFSTKGGSVTLGLPADTTVELDATVDPKLRHGLDNIAAALTTEADVKPAPLKENATTTLHLDLTRFGGIKGLYRFTYHAGSAKGKAKPARRILVEQLGAPTVVPGQAVPAAPQPGQQPAPDPVADKMKQHSIGQSYRGAELQALRAAIAQVPDAQLSVVAGLRFVRKSVHPTKPTVAGNYDPKTHTVTMFDNAFGSTQNVFHQGSRATSYATRAITHEIGHAVDYEPIRRTDIARKTADAAVAGLSSKYPDPDNPSGWRWTSAAEKKDIDATVKAQKDAERAQLQAKSRSGTTTRRDKTTGDIEDVIGTSPAGPAYRAAATRDGVAVSAYGEEDWQESYAEAYSLYISAPDTLRSLRPATFAYLDKNLPK